MSDPRPRDNAVGQEPCAHCGFDWSQPNLEAVRSVDASPARYSLRDWVLAAREAPGAAEIAHPVFGFLSTHDAIVRNAHEVQHHGRDIELALSAVSG